MAAQNAALAAKDAYMAAMTASDEAADATDSATAEAARDMAQAEQAKAEAAQADAIKYAGMVQTAQNALDEAEQERMDLADAKSAAMTAAGDARMAATAARAAANRVAELEPGSQAAMDAAEAARMAEDEALLAEAANTRAQAATTSDEAKMHQSTAEGHRDSAQGHETTADNEKMMAEGRKTEMDNLADARTDARTAAVAARDAATKARTAANKIAELLGASSTAAMEAADDATNAETAATAAEMAADNADDATTSEVAGNERDTAEEKQGDAERLLAALVLAQKNAQIAHDANTEQRRIADIAAAKTAAGNAVTAAETAKDDAAQAAMDAEQARDDAQAAYMRAMAARTDSTTAKAEYEKAKTAATAARQAADDAEAAYMAAKMAADGIMDDGTAEDAESAQMTAETEQGNAEAAEMTADMQKMAAETALEDAMKAADTHVVGLLMMANAYHITAPDNDLPDTPLNESTTEDNENQDMVKAAHVAAVNTAVSTANADATDPSHGGGTVTSVTYPYWTSLGTDGTIGGEGVNADTGPGEGQRAMTVTPTGGDAIALRHAGPGADADDPADDLVANYGMGPGLGGFDEFYLSGLDTTTTDDLNDFNRQRVILFTDLEQGSAGRAPQVVSYFGEPVVASRIATVDTGTPVADTERDYNATYDHDGDEDTAAIAVVLNCGTTCNLRVVNGEVLSISGYTFSTAGNVTVTGVEPEEDDTWLGFGIWLTETVVDGDTNTYAFGAFADGGAAVGDTDEPATVTAVTGEARYDGQAAGVHSTATEVEFFHGTAVLNAKFGTGAEDGTITGGIYDIVSGGRSLGQHDYIELLVTDPGAATPSPNIVAAGTFGGQTRMGPITGTDSAGESTYQFTGTWSGAFYNHMAADPDNAPTVGNDMAPGSIAGTFGVGRGDDTTTTMMDETESFVGAFGAHCTTADNCNPHDE